MNILFHTNLQHLNVPAEIFFNDLFIDSKKEIWFAGDDQTGHFLRIATLAQKTTLNTIEWPVGTELIFYDPLTTKMKNRVISAKPVVDLKILDEIYPSGEKIYFDLDGHVIVRFPEEESRYDNFGRLKKKSAPNL